MSQDTPRYRPFRSTSSASAYVPRADTERALDAMQRWALDSTGAVLVLSGPPGIGKTLLLKVLVTRLGNKLSSVYIPYAELSARELSEWVLNALGKPRGDDPVAMLAREAASRRQQGAMILLLVDDAPRLPVETARALEDWARAEAPALRLALGVDSGGADTAPMRILGRRATHVTLQALLTRSEAATLLRAELGRAGVGPEVRARFSLPVLEAVYEASGGVPARLLQEAARHLPRYQDADLPLDPAPEPKATRLPEPITAPTAAPEAPPPPRPTRRRFGAAPVAWLALGAILGSTATLGLQALHPVGVVEPTRSANPVSAPPPLPRAPAPRVALETEATLAEPSPALVPMIPEVIPEPAPPPLVTPEPIVTEGTIPPGSWLAAALRERNVPDAIGALIARELAGDFDFRQSRAGQQFRLVRDAEGRLLEFDYTISPGESVHLRVEGEGYVARRESRELSAAPPPPSDS